MSECVDKLPSNAKATAKTTTTKAARTTVTEITVQLTPPLATCRMQRAAVAVDVAMASVSNAVAFAKLQHEFTYSVVEGERQLQLWLRWLN